MIRIGINSLFVILLSAFFPCSSVAEEQVVGLIKEYLHVMRTAPTLDNNLKFDCCGEGELIFEHKICEEKGWVPKGSTLIEERCIRFTNERAKHSKTSPSLELLWLRSKLPLEENMQIVSEERKSANSPYVVRAKLGKTDVVFHVFFAGDGYREVSVQRINGNDIFDILDKEIQDGFRLSVLLGGAP